jgi:hypothetical protein
VVVKLLKYLGACAGIALVFEDLIRRLSALFHARDLKPEGGTEGQKAVAGDLLGCV